MSMGQLYLKVLIIMVALFVFMIPGFVLKRMGKIGEGGTLTLSNLLLYVCQPMLAIKSFCVFSDEDWAAIQEMSKLYILKNFAITAAIAAIGYVVMFAICKLVFIRWKNKSEADVYSFIAIFSNCGFLGLPFIQAFTDNDPMAVMYLMVVNIVFLIFCWTLGVYLITGNVHYIRPRKVLLNPAIIFSVIGLILFFVPKINFFMIESVEYLQIIPEDLSAMTAPLSMIIVGIRLADIHVKNLFNRGGIYLAGFLRLIIAPAITLCIGLCFRGLLDYTSAYAEEYVFLAPVISMAMSPAASVVAMAETFGGDRETATTAFVSNTLISIVFIPLAISVAMII
ncbi:MAG: AEC family transporter [Clostridia bacterium]|nr:AEC family transporter [Clostridia bacterium]